MLSNRELNDAPITEALGVAPKSVVVDGASLAVVRIVFGLVGLVSMTRLVAYGWVNQMYADPQLHLRYPGFGWVPTPGRVGVSILVGVVAAASLAITLGWRTRSAATVFLVCFGWIELIDVSTYLNHYWFMTLAALLLIAAPTNTCMAIQPRRVTVDQRWIWLFRFQVGLVYCFAGIAKLNSDWLVHGAPLSFWLPARSTLAGIGWLLEEPITAMVASWAGALFDCTIVAFLLWPRTRRVAWLGVVVFHVATWILFPIGVFPWLMIGATTIFFQPSWPRRFGPHRCGSQDVAPQPHRHCAPRSSLMLAWVVLMLAIPLRAGLIDGDARWTLEGYRLAWNVLLIERGADVRFRVVNLDTGVTALTTASDLYTPLQWKVMSGEPELIRQAAHEIVERRARDGEHVAVYADAFVSLNGRPAARIIDPSVDLGHEPFRPFGQPWILPAPSGSAPNAASSRNVVAAAPA